MTCSGFVDCFLRSLSGRFNSHDTSVDDADDCRLGFRKRTFGGIFVDCRDGLVVRGYLMARRSARESFLRVDTPISLTVIEPEFSANLSRSRVEKYYIQQRQLAENAETEELAEV